MKSLKMYKQILKKYKKRSDPINYFIFNCILKCSECGGNLYRIKTKKNGEIVAFYYCGTYIKTKNCNNHFILEKELDNIVLTSINKYIELICNASKNIEELASYSRLECNEEVTKLRKKEIEKEKYKKLLNELSKDYQNDFLSQEDYYNFKEKYLFELNQLNIEMEELDNKNKIYNLDWLENFKKYKQLTLIDRNIVNSFTKNIFVGNDKHVEICFRYKDQYEDVLNYLKKNNNNMI